VLARGPLRVSQRHQTMSAATAAFLGSGRRVRATVASPTTVNRACNWWRNMLQLRTMGPAAIAAEIGGGITVVAEEMVRRLSGGTEPVSLFVLAPPPSPDHPPGRTVAEDQRMEGFSEGTVGAVQTFFLRSDSEPWTKDRLSALAPLDTVIHLSRERASAKIYPTVNVLTSRSRLLEENSVSADHAAIAEQVRQALAALWAPDPHSEADSATLGRALKLQNYFTQPFFVAEPYTKRPERRQPKTDFCEILRTAQFSTFSTASTQSRPASSESIHDCARMLARGHGGVRQSAVGHHQGLARPGPASERKAGGHLRPEASGCSRSRWSRSETRSRRRQKTSSPGNMNP
jgi:hypothetical protein